MEQSIAAQFEDTVTAAVVMTGGNVFAGDSLGIGVTVAELETAAAAAVAMGTVVQETADVGVVAVHNYAVVDNFDDAAVPTAVTDIGYAETGYHVNVAVAVYEALEKLDTVRDSFEKTEGLGNVVVVVLE